MVDCEGLKSIYNGYTAVKPPGPTAIWSGSPRHGDAEGADATHAEAFGAGAPHADAAGAGAIHADAADALHAGPGVAEATHAEAPAAVAPHADAAVAGALHAAAAVAEAAHAGAAGAEANHAEAARASALHAGAAGAAALHAGPVAAGLAVDAVASDRGSDGEYGVGADAGIGAAEERLSTRVCEVVPTNEDGGVVCHLRSLLSCTLKQRAQAGVGRVASPLVSRRRAGSGPAPSHEVPPPRNSYSILPEGGPAHQANELFIETFLTNFRELRNHDVARQLALGRSKRARTAGRAAGLRWVLCARYARTGA